MVRNSHRTSDLDFYQSQLYISRVQMLPSTQDLRYLCGIVYPMLTRRYRICEKIGILTHRPEAWRKRR